MSVQWPGGGPPAQQPQMRASHADRDRATDVLRAGYAEGRLTKDEYDARVDAVLRAATHGELSRLVGDLPQGPATVPAPLPPTFLPHPLAHPPQQNGMALGSLICGVLIPFTGVSAIPAVVLGHKARAEIRRTGERGDGMALAGLVLGYLAIVTFALLVVGGLALFSAVEGIGSGEGGPEVVIEGPGG